MSDIGLKGIAGFIVIGGTTLILALVTVIAAAAALVVCSRRQIPVGPALARYTGGPLVSTAIALSGLGWAWNRATDSVDELAPLIALGSVLAGVVAAVLVRRSVRTATRGLPRS